ncbi:MAG: formylmethanofuran dehydrogenase subunit B, partial [Candidatus Bathyarchaeia archaeon]
MAVFRDVVCTVCGCCCDDLEVEVQNGKIIRAKNACALSLSKLLSTGEERLTKPMIRRGRRLAPAPLSRAVMRAATILAKASYPVLWGWSLTSCEAIERGVELAELVGGVIDNNTSVCHGPGLIGVQDVGVSSCSLGEAKNRADLVVYWGANPVHAHPRHLARYTVQSKGRFRSSRSERTMVVVDVRRTDTAKLADIFIQARPNTDYELLTALRCAVNGEELEQEEVGGVPLEEIERLADLMTSSQFGIIFYGVGLTMSRGKARNLDAALSLVKDLNRRTKFLIMPMRGHFNVTGANEVIAWQTGYPFAVDFSRGFPYYNPGDTTFSDVLNRRECDAALIVGSDPIIHLPASTSRFLKSIPLITIDPHLTPTVQASQVAIPSTLVGIETEGTVYRMDVVPLKAKSILPPPPNVRSDMEILEMIIRSVK